MTVNDYLNVMLANDAVREQILKNLSKLQRILSEDTCHVVQQISDFDLDVIEVSNGCAFRISTREFFVFRKEDFDGKSSRAFVPYDCLSPPDPGRFAEGINNSFPILEERVKVLNKLYRCLVAYRMPQKVRKLVFLGPKNSGKTSWSAIFRRIMPVDKIVSVATGGQFSAGMIRNETELVIANHLSSNKLFSWFFLGPRTLGRLLGLPSSVVSCRLTRSFLSRPVLSQYDTKRHRVGHKDVLLTQPQALFDCPFYITTNCLPNSGDQNHRVYRRSHIFRIQIL